MVMVKRGWVAAVLERKRTEETRGVVSVDTRLEWMDEKEMQCCAVAFGFVGVSLSDVFIVARSFSSDTSPIRSSSSSFSQVMGPISSSAVAMITSVVSEILPLPLLLSPDEYDGNDGTGEGDGDIGMVACWCVGNCFHSSPALCRRTRMALQLLVSMADQ